MSINSYLSLLPSGSTVLISTKGLASYGLLDERVILLINGSIFSFFLTITGGFSFGCLRSYLN